MALALLAAAALSGCGSHRQPSKANSAACAALAGTIANQEDTFVARVKAIRVQHVLFREYDRQMIAAITDRRTALQSTTLTGMSVIEEISGCSGKPLDDLRRRAQQEVVSLTVFLNTFRRALKWDPEGEFIDQL